MIVVNDEYYFRGSTSLPFRCTSSIWWRALIICCHYTRFLFSTDSCHLLKPRLKHFNCLFRFACHFLINFFTYFTHLIFSFAVCKLHVWMCEVWMCCLYFMWMMVSKCIGAWVWCVVEVKFMGLWMEVFSDVQAHWQTPAGFRVWARGSCRNVHIRSLYFCHFLRHVVKL